MLKQSYSKMKKVLAILLTVLFIVSVTAVAAGAHVGGHGGFGGGWGWGGYPYWGYGTGCVWVNGNWSCPSYVGMPYTMPASAPAAPATSPNFAGVAIFS
jgi:hypothetical protein